MKLKYDDLSPQMKRQVDWQLAKTSPQKSVAITPTTKTVRPCRMTKTEQAYEAELIALYGRDNVFFEALTLRLRNGHRYTPDFVVRIGHGDLAMIEVKGSYRLHSYQRARLAFDQAKLDWPEFFFRWVEKRNGTFEEVV